MESKIKLPGTLRVIHAIGRVTFFEIIRDKVLYNIFLCTFLLFGVGWLASKLTVIRPERVILDFGLATVGLSCAVIALFTGAGMLGRELERRTVHVALSRPISRAQFVLGKFSGLAAVLALNWFLLAGAFLGLLCLTSEGGSVLFSSTLGIALGLILIQGLLLASLSILISTLSTTSLTVILSLGLYLIGNTISQLRMVAVRSESSFGRFVLNSVATVLPNFEYFNLGNQVTYGLAVSWKYVGLSILYGCVMIAISLILAGLLIEVREV